MSAKLLDVRNTLAEGAGDFAPVAVLDIGSNSVRLVVYERHARTLTPFFNEKAACALGRGVAKTGDIAAKNAARALKAIKRFALVVRLLNVDDVHILATSAVREAANGAAFMEVVAHLMGIAGHVLSGVEEAHFAALGVVSGMPGFSGMVGDLGGGSLELSLVSSGVDTKGETLELGVIRLQDDSSMSPEKACKIAARRLKSSKILNSDTRGVFCAIGGTWRALAKVLQMQSDYPMRMVQDYTVEASQVLELADQLVSDNVDVTELEQINRMRAGLLPYGAAVLARIIRAGNVKKIIFSSLGVREGYLYARLGRKQREVDPLLQAVEDMCILRSRSPRHARDLMGFTAHFLDVAGESESVNQRRLRESVCLLSDIGWRGHKDYRGEQSVEMVAYSALTGVDHPGRAFMAEALAVRYMGPKHQSASHRLTELIGQKELVRARLIGGILRVAYALSGAMPELLPRVGLASEGENLVLELPDDLSILHSARLDTRLNQLGKHLKREVGVKYQD
jgi:exopolyphosphatase / guanosine-5'-triphosphate,3'-diphosphate pyrophosphatase